MARFLSFLAVVLVVGWGGLATAQGDFVNFESPHVHPLDLSPSGSLLAACNTADNHVELFDVATGTPTRAGSVAVGYDPVSVRFRTDGELWVVNHVSDSVSIIDIAKGIVVATLPTRDEPCDVVFAGSPERAFISCSQANTILVVDPADPGAPPQEVVVDAEDPRALAVSNDGMTVYAAIFESGNGTTILGGGSEENGVITHPPNVVDDLNTPHGGQNPPFNGSGVFIPAKAPNGTPPEVGLIVRDDGTGTWFDDTGADWTQFVRGDQGDGFSQSGRIAGWQLLDHDIAVIDTGALSVSYVDRLMNIDMAIAVNPASGVVSAVGTDALNEVRFEPIVNGVFLRVNLALVDPTGPTSSVVDLNPHLDYLASTVSQTQRDQSIGDPRAMVWNSAGTQAFVAGMGSNNLVVVDAAGDRAGLAPTIAVGEGPTGLALDEARNRLYVLNKFGASISVVGLGSETEIARVSFFDATPPEIRSGRKHLYDTHKNSGLGHIACASCHVDARIDRLAWDLGDPSGSVKSFAGQNLGMGVPGLTGGFQNFHPMKGPMTTQTLLDIIGKEPFHWRGDRDGLEEFNGAFMTLQGDDTQLTAQEMQEYENFLASLHFPPNSFRPLDNTLPANVDLTGHYASGRFAGSGGLAEGAQLPNGNAQHGLGLYRDLGRRLDSNTFTCVQCHTLPIGSGSDMTYNGAAFVPLPLGPNGEHHLGLVSVDGSTNRAIKIPQLRNQYDKTGFEMSRPTSRAGFGLLHDGSVDSIARFVSEGTFQVQNDQEVADLVALILSFSGSDFPPDGGFGAFFEPPGVPSQDAHAAVGKQVTLTGGAKNLALLNDLIAIADSGKIDLIATSAVAGVPRGWLREGGAFTRDETAAGPQSLTQVFAEAAPNPVTFTAAPLGTGVRLGLDRDRDTVLDFDERAQGTSPANPDTDGDGTDDAVDAFPRNAQETTDADGDGLGDNFEQLIVDAAQNDADPTNDWIQTIDDVEPNGDFDGDSTTNLAEFLFGTDPTDAASALAGPSALWLTLCAALAGVTVLTRRRRAARG